MHIASQLPGTEIEAGHSSKQELSLNFNGRTIKHEIRLNPSHSGVLSVLCKYLPIITVCILVDDNRRGKQQKTVCTEADEDLTSQGARLSTFLDPSTCSSCPRRIARCDDFRCVSKQLLDESMGFHLTNLIKEYCLTLPTGRFQQFGASSESHRMQCPSIQNGALWAGEPMLVKAAVKTPFHSLQ